MLELNFLVQGSKGDIYKVRFRADGNNIDAFCDCRAGQNRNYCKHRFALMNGDISNLQSTNPEDIEKLRIAMSGTDLEAAHRRVSVAETNYEGAKRELEEAKKSLALAMHR